eukprot:XP_001709181.1 Hypothetical protein GL50803_37203 [Giardia lamblia ATCC 50803]
MEMMPCGPGLPFTITELAPRVHVTIRNVDVRHLDVSGTIVHVSEPDSLVDEVIALGTCEARGTRRCSARGKVRFVAHLEEVV